jgi:hypothetical protein
MEQQFLWKTLRLLRFHWPCFRINILLYYEQVFSLCSNNLLVIGLLPSFSHSWYGLWLLFLFLFHGDWGECCTYNEGTGKPSFCCTKFNWRRCSTSSFSHGCKWFTHCVFEVQGGSCSPSHNSASSPCDAGLLQWCDVISLEDHASAISTVAKDIKFITEQVLGLLLANDHGTSAKYIRKHHLVHYLSIICWGWKAVLFLG